MKNPLVSFIFLSQYLLYLRPNVVSSFPFTSFFNSLSSLSSPAFPYFLYYRNSFYIPGNISIRKPLPGPIRRVEVRVEGEERGRSERNPDINKYITTNNIYKYINIHPMLNDNNNYAITNNIKKDIYTTSPPPPTFSSSQSLSHSSSSSSLPSRPQSPPISSLRASHDCTSVPSNPYLSSGPWSATQRNSFAQSSSPLVFLPSEAAAKDVTHDVYLDPFNTADPIGLLYSSDGGFVWGSSFTSIFKLDRRGRELRLTGFISRGAGRKDDTGEEGRDQRDVFHGAYSVLSGKDVFYTSSGSYLEAYGDDPRGRGSIKLLDRQNIEEGWDRGKRGPLSVQAICMLYEGSLAFVTNNGYIGVIRITNHVKGKFGERTKLIHLSPEKREEKAKGDKVKKGEEEEEEEEVDVSNGMACDEEGGIYVVSDKYLHKALWKGGRLMKAWDSPYPSDKVLSPSRLGQGSGSTPSLMGTRSSGRFIVITDGSRLMNLLVMRADDGRIVGKARVTFGETDGRDAISEQSVLVVGYRMVVVNNTPKSEMVAAVTDFLARAHIPYIDPYVNSLPVAVGDSPRGIHQFEFNPKSLTLTTTWVNKHISIPNGIPSVSCGDGLMYGIGRRLMYELPSASPISSYLKSMSQFASRYFPFSDLSSLLPSALLPGPFRGLWTLEGIDWMTGESVFTYSIGRLPFYNSLYAATEIGPGEIITGVAGGVVRIRSWN